MARPISRLPSLNALRAFVAAARHLSFAKAGAELHVTPAAVSQQVRLLEEALGCQLFRRTGRGIVLTEAAQACLPGLTDGFERIGEALSTLDDLAERGVLTVSVAPSFAAKWLVPRLDNFAARHPEVDVRVSATMHLVDFDGEGIDCAIRFGPGDYAGLHAEKLLSESVYPVCSPSLLEGADPLRVPGDLVRCVLLHDGSPDLDPSCPDWPMWLRAAQVDHPDPTHGVHLNQSSLVLEAAISGRGVALAKARLAADDIRAGRLVKPFDVRHPLEFSYWFVAPAARRSAPRVRAFLTWLREEAAADSEA